MLLFLLPGDDSTEAKISLKYSHSKKSLVAEVLVPRYNVEAGVKITVTDYDSGGNKTYGATVDVTNRKVPLVTLLGQTRSVSHGDSGVCGVCRGRQGYEGVNIERNQPLQ